MGARAVGDKNALAWAVFVLGNVDWLQTAEPTRAMPLFEEALSLLPTIQDWNLYIWVQFALAAAARVQANHARAEACYTRGNGAAAARLFGAASQTSETDPVEFVRVDREADVAAARRQLGDAVFDEVFSEGRAMTTDQSIDLALRGEAPRRRLTGRRGSLSEQ